MVSQWLNFSLTTVFVCIEQQLVICVWSVPIRSYWCTASSLTLNHLLQTTSCLQFPSPNMLTVYVGLHPPVNKGCVFISHIPTSFLVFFPNCVCQPYYLVSHHTSLCCQSTVRSVSVALWWQCLQQRLSGRHWTLHCSPVAIVVLTETRLIEILYGLLEGNVTQWNM
jgi:hypothetical protein